MPGHRTSEDCSPDQQWAELVRASLDRLDPSERAPLWLVYFERLSQDQAADALAVPIAVLAHRVAAGLQSLARVLESGSTA